MYVKSELLFMCPQNFAYFGCHSTGADLGQSKIWILCHMAAHQKYVNTFPQATIALRKRMVDMNYIDGNLVAPESGEYLENF